jgi:hypothetical protein
MIVFPLSKDCLDNQYHGCGKAWAAMREGQVVALAYFEPVVAPNPRDDDIAPPAWVRAVQDAEEGCDSGVLPTAWSSAGLAKIAAAAGAAADYPRPPRKDRYRPRELLTMARAVLIALNTANFLRWRERVLPGLEAQGEVWTGMLSCTEFCALHRAEKDLDAAYDAEHEEDE